MSLATRTPMRPCGKPFASPEDALRSKRGQAGGWLPVPCVTGYCPDGTHHLQREATAPAPAPRKAPADTGPDARTRAIVLERDGYRCVRCGKPCGPRIAEHSIQHRVARGVGGDNSLPNLILLCGSAVTSCHGAVESRKDARDQAAGWRLESWQNPATEGVLYVSEHGSGVLMYLDNEGGISPDAPTGSVA